MSHVTSNLWASAGGLWKSSSETTMALVQRNVTMALVRGLRDFQTNHVFFCPPKEGEKGWLQSLYKGGFVTLLFNHV